MVLVLVGVAGVGPASSDAAPWPTGSISGVVATTVEGASLPVAGVHVEVLTSTGRLVAEATSGSDGTYSAAVPIGCWKVRFTRPGFVPLNVVGVRVRPRHPVATVDAQLDYLQGDGAAIYGRVSTDTGEHPDSDVILRHFGDPTPIVPIADDAGRFLFPGVEPGTYTLQVTPSGPWESGWWSPEFGFGKASIPFAVGSENIHAAVSVSADQVDISGQVIDNFGNTLISGTVEAVDPTTGAVVAQDSIDETGVFDVVFPPPVPAQVALHFVPDPADDTHLQAWLGGTDVMTPASIVDLTGGDVVVDFFIPSPAYPDS